MDLYFLGFVLRQLILREGLGATVETARRRWAWSPTLGSEENTAQTEPFSKPAVFEWPMDSPPGLPFSREVPWCNDLHRKGIISY